MCPSQLSPGLNLRPAIWAGEKKQPKKSRPLSKRAAWNSSTRTVAAPVSAYGIANKRSAETGRRGLEGEARRRPRWGWRPSGAQGKRLAANMAKLYTSRPVNCLNNTRSSSVSASPIAAINKVRHGRQDGPAIVLPSSRGSLGKRCDPSRLKAWGFLIPYWGL